MITLLLLPYYSTLAYIATYTDIISWVLCLPMGYLVFIAWLVFYTWLFYYAYLLSIGWLVYLVCYTYVNVLSYT